MSGLTPRGREIVAAARALLESEGPEALSMRRVADHLGIRAPSLYRHLPDKAALEAAIVSEGLAEQGRAFAAALAGAPDAPLVALAAAYRRFARDHPHLYRLMTEGPLPRDMLTPGVEAEAARPLLAAVGDDADLARAVWAFAHGMSILEIDGRFPPGADLDAAWRAGLKALAPAAAGARMR